MSNKYNNDNTLRETIRSFTENLLNDAGKYDKTSYKPNGVNYKLSEIFANKMLYSPQFIKYDNADNFSLPDIYSFISKKNNIDTAWTGIQDNGSPNFIQGHKYLIGMQIKSTGDTLAGYYIRFGNQAKTNWYAELNNSINVVDHYTFVGIHEQLDPDDNDIRFLTVSDHADTSVVLDIKNLFIIDLTLIGMQGYSELDVKKYYELYIDAITDTFNEVFPTDVDFVLGKDFIRVNSKMVKLKTLDDTFRKVEDTYTIAIIEDFLGIPEPLKGYELITYTIPMIIFVSTKNKYTEIKESLEKFSRSLIGENFEENGYFFGTNCSEVTNTERVVDLNGVEYVRYSVTVFITSSKNAIINNFVETYMGPVIGIGTFDVANLMRIYPVERNTTRAFIPEETHKNNEKESTTIYRESTWVSNLGIVIDKSTAFYKELLVELEEPTMLNKTYSYRVIYPFDSPLVTDKVVGIEGMTLDAEIGNYAILSLVLKLSGING